MLREEATYLVNNYTTLMSLLKTAGDDDADAFDRRGYVEGRWDQLLAAAKDAFEADVEKSTYGANLIVGARWAPCFFAFRN